MCVFNVSQNKLRTAAGLTDLWACGYVAKTKPAWLTEDNSWSGRCLRSQVNCSCPYFADKTRKAQGVPLTHIQTRGSGGGGGGYIPLGNKQSGVVRISNPSGFQGLESLLISLCSPMPNNCSPPLPAPPCHFLAALGTEGFLLLHREGP